MKRRNGEKRLKSVYSLAHQRLMRILYLEDPDAMGSSVGAPDDEYSEEATRLMTSLMDATTAQQVRKSTLHEFPEANEELIRQVLDVWRGLKSKAAPDGAADS